MQVLYLLFFTLMLNPNVDVKATEASHELTIRFTGYEKVKGQILFKIVDEENEEVTKQVLPLSSLNQSVTLSLPKGKYAVSAFHDENNNNKLDKNLVGMPTEKYGFSNNVRGKFGPPSLTSQLFELTKNFTTSITLK